MGHYGMDLHVYGFLKNNESTYREMSIHERICKFLQYTLFINNSKNKRLPQNWLKKKTTAKQLQWAEFMSIKLNNFLDIM